MARRRPLGFVYYYDAIDVVNDSIDSVQYFASISGSIWNNTEEHILDRLCLKNLLTELTFRYGGISKVKFKFTQQKVFPSSQFVPLSHVVLDIKEYDRWENQIFIREETYFTNGYAEVYLRF